MEPFETLYDLQRQVISDLEGADCDKAEELVRDFRRQVEVLGIEISDLPLDGIEGTISGNDDRTVCIQSTFDCRNPKTHVSFKKHKGG